MERIQFGEFQFDTGAYELTYHGQVVALDPRMVALLVFCLDNPNRIITRDELQDAIWQGVIVTDNAINKLVANLRKTLNDDPKSPQYIQTVPKLGYRFIASISKVGDVKGPNYQRYLKSSSSYNNKVLGGALIGLLVIAVFVWNSIEDTELSYGENSVLTRVLGAKRSLVVAPKGNSVSFINDTRGHGNTLWMKHLGNNHDDVGTEVSSGEYYIESLIAQTSTSLIFYGYNEGQCGWFKAPFTEQANSIERAHVQRLGCDNLVAHRLTYATKQEAIWLLGHARNHEHRNTLYKVNFESGVELVNIALPQDWHFVSVDLKPDSNDLLLIAHNSQGISRLFDFDIESQTLSILADIQQQIEFGIWGQGGGDVVYVSASKPTQLQLFNTQNDKEQTLVSLGDRICCELARHPNEKDYIYSTYDKNIDLNWQTAGFELDNSNGNERLPAFANDQVGIYFASNRAGHSYIYFQAPEQRATPIFPIAEHAVLRGLSVSPDDRFVLLNHDNHQLWLLDNEERKVTQQTYLDGYGFAQSWINSTLFAITVKQNKTRKVRVYNRQLQLVAELPSSWVRLMVDKTDKKSVYVYNQQSELYRFNLADVLNGQMKNGALLGEIAHFHQGVIEKGVLYAGNDKETTLTTYKIHDDSLQRLSQKRFDGYYGFDVRDGQIIYASARAFSSDLYTTRAQ
ncbi:hypothetical protein CTT31_06680 [Pseudoalteromonas maricaloris]|uniref:winged helix-turn-helix domain-containing protein n=1 Tax=Pseudoalteromonas maricaloris TaxID=184924 RepID=UPI0021ADE029|nr:winged helix-turn-helix domain-containing protein [Pseudoalteromonas flavipulchra]USE68824.1 hypothetical protein CTT31_06680 [Pseudoalteromonas flavipulchra]